MVLPARVISFINLDEYEQFEAVRQCVDSINLDKCSVPVMLYA